MQDRIIRRILVVDDEEQYRSVVQEFIKRIGFECDSAPDAPNALLTLAATGEFDVVISDIRMGEMDGLQMTREAKKRYPHIDFIVMTGHASEYTYSDIIEAGASDFIAKPFSIGELKAKIERIERERRIIRHLYTTNKLLVWEASVNSSIADLSKALISSSSIEDMSLLVLRHAKSLTQSPVGFAGHMDKKTGSLVSPGFLEANDGNGGGGRVRESWELMLRYEDPLLVNDLSEGEWRSRLGADCGIERFLSVPATVNSIVFGHIVVGNSKTPYTERDLSVVKRLAAIFAMTVQRKWAEEELQRAHSRLQTALEDTIYALTSALEMRDPYTGGHQRRVADLALAIARGMHLPDEVTKGVYMAGLVHDIGKIYVPSEILSKPARLRRVEMDLIRHHSIVGHDILKDVKFPWPIAQIVLQHHERLDGCGYPQGLSGSEILLEARIIGVADVVEAMSSHRPYRAALGIEKALKEITDRSGVLYDSEIVRVCTKLFRDERFEFNRDPLTASCLFDPAV